MIIILQEEIEKFVIRSADSQKYIEDDEHFNSNSIINYLDELILHQKIFKPHIPHHTGFGLSLLKGKSAHIHSYELDIIGGISLFRWKMGNYL